MKVQCKAARVALLAVACGSRVAFACTDDGALISKHHFSNASTTPTFVLVEQHGQDLWLELQGKRKQVRYNLPNNRSGVEVAALEPALGRDVELCIHSTYRHADGEAVPTPTLIVAGQQLADGQNDLLRQYAEAGRLWALDDAASHQQAVALLETLVDRSGPDPFNLIPSARLALVRASLVLADYQRALALIEKYRLESAADPMLAMESGLATATVQLRTNRSGKALDSMEAVVERAPQSLLAAELYNRIGEALITLGRLADGKKTLEKALTIAANDHALLARIHNNLGFLKLRQAYAGSLAADEIEQGLLASIDEHLIARLFAISANEPEERLIIENNLGSLYERVGELRNASRHYRESLKLADPARDPYTVRVIYQNLGNLSQKLGDYIKARSYLESAGMIRASLTTNGEMYLQCLIGRNYQLLKQYDRAIAIHRDCRESAAKAGDHKMEMDSLADLAEDYLMQARAQQLQADDKPSSSQALAWQSVSEARALWNAGIGGGLSSVVAGQGVCDEKRTLSSGGGNNNKKEGGAGLGETDLRLGLKILSRYALLAAANGKQADAMQSLEQAQQLTAVASYPEQVEFFNAAIQVQKRSGDVDAAMACGERALAFVEALHEGLAAERYGAAWSAKTHELYVTLADMLLTTQLANGKGAQQGQLERALGIIERSRAINLRQQLAMTRPADTASLEQQRMRAELDRIAASATGEGLGDILPTAYYHQYDLLELARLNDIKAVPVPAPLGLREIQQRLLPHQRVLYYFIADASSYVFELGATSVDVHRLGTTAALKALLDPVVSGDKKPGAFPLPALNKLAQFLLPADLAQSNASELLIVPHRGLDTVPFAALQLPGSTEYSPLIARFAVKEVPSLSAYFMEKARRPPGSRKDFAVFADPVFARDNLVADAESLPDGFRGGDEPTPYRTWTGKLERLPYTGIEARNLVAGFQKGRVLEFTGPKATLSNLVSADVRAARILHIATHGYFHSTSSDNVGLVLSAVDENSHDVANFVTLSELLGHNFDNELVVISGCDTAMGLELDGEGMMGLTRGFLAQGAGQVVSTLWPVSDRASAEFMKLFYRHLHEHNNVALALQQAQGDLSRNATYRSPYYWAGYVLTSVTPEARLSLRP